MGFFDKIYNGATDVVTGPVEFIADGFQATETLFTEGPTEALGVVLNSFQEDILGQTMGGLFGPEGIGGAVFGAIPEPIRMCLATSSIRCSGRGTGAFKN